LALQVVALVVTVTPSINNTVRFLFMVAGPLACVTMFLLWLGFASRLAWKERLAITFGWVLIGVAAALVSHSSMGVGLWAYGVPLAMGAITVVQLFGRTWPSRRRQISTLVLLAAGAGMFALGRIDGVAGNYVPEVSWRWSQTPEQRLLEQLGESPGGVASTDATDLAAWQVSAVEWPGFRGAGGNSQVDEMIPELNWGETPPRELWRNPLGPGWSSFACVSGRLFTQEQRGASEVVSCYDAASGAPIWQHADPSRFSDVVSGAGPRATPTFVDGTLFTYGGRAVLNALDATDGRLLWQHDLMQELGAKLPVWGFSSSPLVIGDAVIVHAGGDADNGLVAYQADSGDPLWQIASPGMNFSSAQKIEIGDRVLAAFSDAAGILAVDPATGDVVWRFTPQDWSGPPIVQLQQIGPSSLIVPLGDGIGVARLDVTYAGGDWAIQERWTSNKLKPSFNDFVFHRGAVFGFDQSIFVCLDAETGQRRWKGGRYGFGQVLLLSEPSQLLITTETGELVLLAADDTRHVELDRLPVLQGKTWNHPIVADGRLFLRNGVQAVCLDLLGR
jgi:outer membrane protein assembly factor BamB